MKNKDEMRFVYFGREKRQNINSKDEEYTQWIHDGVTCIGYLIDPAGNLVVAVSFCSPDDEFSKKKARMIIRGRIEHGKSELLAALTSDAGLSYADMSYEEIITEIRKNVNAAYDADTNTFGSVPWPLWFQGV